MFYCQSSMYSVISPYLTKTLHMPQQEGTREMKRKKKEKEKRRGYIRITLQTNIHYTYLHFHRLLQCNFNTENILCRSAQFFLL